jgi:hypothetical protein
MLEQRKTEQTGMNRRNLLFTPLAFCAPHIGAERALALGGTAAVSAPISGPAKLRVRATSISVETHWGIYVQECVVRHDEIVPVALISCFEFGRKQDPFVYPELNSPLLPIIAGPSEPFKIAVYFFEGREASLQPHSDAALLANRFETAEDASGRTTSMKVSYWDNAALPTAVVHEISIAFAYFT